MANEMTGSPALAHLIHQTDLSTWLVRTAGTVLAVLVLAPLAFGIVVAVVDPDGGGVTAGAVLGAVVGGIAAAVLLSRATAPLPSEEVLGLLDASERAS